MQPVLGDCSDWNIHERRNRSKIVPKMNLRLDEVRILAQKIEKAAHRVLATIYGEDRGTPDWLNRPGRKECGSFWSLVQEIYHELTGGELPDVMPSREWRKVDGMFQTKVGTFIFELDEKQHFNAYRSKTLSLYPENLSVGFSIDLWINICNKKSKLEGGRFAKPKPPLFTGENGRHRQRAFRDSLTDILPLEYGLLPTLRIADFEIRAWIHESEAQGRMESLVESRLGF